MHLPMLLFLLLLFLLLLQMKAALGEDSRRLKAELETAKQLLRTRMAARRGSSS
jgi:hypothetical protein